MPIEVLDLFSAAAGGWSLGLHRAGFTTIAACEVEPWRRALYSENNPKVKVYHDVRTLTADRLFSDLGRLPSVVVGSPPCQDISSANTKGRGVEGARSGLYFEAIRIIGEIRPRWFALENSANLRTRGADAVCAALEVIGYTSWPVVVRAGDIGANHERARCWLIGCDLEQIADLSQIGRAPWTGSSLAARRADGGHQSADDAHDADRLARGPVSDLCKGPEAIDARSAAAPHTDRNGEHAPPVNGEMAIVCRLAADREPGEPADADQARQAHGCVESCIRQEEIADDGCGAGWSNDGSRARQVDLCTPDRDDTEAVRAGWSLANLADHLRLDDGLSTRLADIRCDVGDNQGQSAASLIVEAFGDAVVPQIPEAIGRAILRTERALAAIYGEAV